MAARSRRRIVPSIPDPAVQPTLTVPQAARILGISKSCAYEAVKRGDLPVLPMGGRKLVPTARLLSMLGLGRAA